jgi:hypothetical protein
MLSGCELIDTENISLPSQNMTFGGKWAKRTSHKLQILSSRLIFFSINHIHFRYQLSHIQITYTYNILTNRSVVNIIENISLLDKLLWNNFFFLVKFIVWSVIFNQFALGLDNLSNFLKYHLKALQIFVLFLFDYNNTTLMAFT